MAIEIRRVVERFGTGPWLIERALSGEPSRSLKKDAAGWSVCEVLVHLSDAELVRAVRIRLILAEDVPALFSFDEGEWRDRLSYAGRDAEAALRMYRDAVEATADLLENVDPQAWNRTGVHPVDGLLSVGTIIERGIQHAIDHAAQLRDILGR